MKIKSTMKFLSILCCTFFALTTSCDRPSQSKEADQLVPPDNSHPIESKIDTPKLKFTSGVRSILEDEKGNIWFGSYQEGVAVFDGENMTYYNTTDGLSHNQIRSIYEDEKGIIWFEGGTGVSSYDGVNITSRTDRNYDSKSEWTLPKKSLWFNPHYALENLLRLKMTSK